MKPKPERPVSVPRTASARGPRNDRGKMPPRVAVLAPVRKEVRGIGVRARAHIIDRFLRNTGVLELKSYQRGEVAMGRRACPSDNRTALRGTLHLASDFFTDLERLDANVGADRHDEIGRIVPKRLDGARNDARDGAAPAGVYGTDITTRWMPDQDRHAVGRARGDREAFCACDERIAFHVCNGFGSAGC